MFKQKTQRTYKHITLPKSILIGKNVLLKIKTLAGEADSVIVVTGKKTNRVAGKTIAKHLGCDKILVTKADVENVKLVAEKLKNEKINLAVAVGGGKIIDVTKLGAFKAAIDYVTVPTTCSNDGIASPRASIKSDNGSMSVEAFPPIGVIADTNIIRKSPYKFTSGGIGDTISKYTSVRDWKLGHIIKGEYYGDYASSLSLMVAKMILSSVQDIRKRTDTGIGVLLEALISSGAAMGIAGSSRPASGSEHKFSHALDIVADYPAMHGHQCGVGTIIMAYLQGENWGMIKNALETAKCPTTAKGLKVDRDLILKALLKAGEIRPQRYTILDHIRLDKKIAEDALEVTGVI